ncbi:MAG: aminotransferase class I/II-fold pyridoxal phosphate-dependent enzyme [bacterium]
MNPLAKELNEALDKNNPVILEMLSEMGKALFFPKGILSQSAEAKQKAKPNLNATIGIAIENGQAMHLKSISRMLPGLEPNSIFPYAPSQGRPDIRKAWQEKMLRENPSQQGKVFSLPVVTSALTHGLSIVGDMFLDPGDVILLPDKFWGNYRLTYVVRREAEIRTHNTFTEQGGYDVEALKKSLEEIGKEKKKIVLILNFPNNPSGYTPTVEEGQAIADAIKIQAEKGTNIVAVTDDAYFGLFYEDSIKESLFGYLANSHERVLAIKLDGATKEEYVWGFRCGFITFAPGKTDGSDQVLNALEKKTMGCIRGNISNSPNISQTLVLKALESPDFITEKAEKFEIMKARALKVKEVLGTGKYDDSWDSYPFNSGYFMCIKLKKVDAEALRVHILDKYGVGTISINKTDLRIAFSSLEVKDIPEVFDLIYKGAKELE